MTQNEKELLLKDLCTRLPYGVKCEVVKRRIDGEMVFMRSGSSALELTINYFKELVTNNLYEIKPYLFPLSRICDNEELGKEFDGLIELELKAINDEITPTQVTEFEVDFYNKHHLDWRGLIPMGLAIDATNKNIYLDILW
jgi:hypothetical protein